MPLKGGNLGGNSCGRHLFSCLTSFLLARSMEGMGLCLSMACSTLVPLKNRFSLRFSSLGDGLCIWEGFKGAKVMVFFFYLKV